jgi:hypothetical protein
MVKIRPRRPTICGIAAASFPRATADKRNLSYSPSGFNKGILYAAHDVVVPFLTSTTVGLWLQVLADVVVGAIAHSGSGGHGQREGRLICQARCYGTLLALRKGVAFDLLKMISNWTMG